MTERITIDGLSFRFRFDGPALGRVVLLGNPLGVDLTIWDGVIEPLTSHGFRVLRYDHRGHGGTDVPSEPCTFERLAKDCAELLDKLEIEHVHCFCGDSMGAATALYFAARFHGRVSKYVICDTPTAGSTGPNDPFGPRIEIAQMEEGMQVLAEQTAKRWLSPAWSSANPQGFAKIRDMVAQTPAAGFVANARALQNFNLRDTYASVDPAAKYLVVVGALDGVLPRLLEETADALPSAGYRLIPDAGHVPMVDGLEDFLSIIMDFIV